MDVLNYLSMKYSSDIAVNPAARSIFGVAGKHSLGHGDQLYIDYVLSRRPQWWNFVELGTGSGLTTLLLAICANLRKGRLVTFDIKEPIRLFMECWPQCAYHVVLDVLDAKNRDFVSRRVSQADTFLFCDNGKKIEEVNIYAPYLLPGSGFMVHDWNHEVREKDISHTLKDHSFVPLFHKEAESLQSILRAWERVH